MLCISGAVPSLGIKVAIPGRINSASLFLNTKGIFFLGSVQKYVELSMVLCQFALKASLEMILTT
jgi:hypothetical protein